MIVKEASKINRFKGFLRGQSFTANVIRLGGGTALGQALVIATTPIITRLYSPEQMGLMGLFISFVGFASIAVAWRYELAIVSAQDDNEANALLLISLFLVLPTSLLAGLFMLLMIRYDIISYSDLPAWAAGAAAVTLFATGAFTALRYWFVRQTDFSGVSRALVSQGAGRALVPVVLGFAHAGWAGLLAGEVAGRTLGVGRLLRQAWPVMRKSLALFGRDSYTEAMKRNWKFPALLLPSTMVSVLAATLPLPAISSLFGVAAAGQFLLVWRLIQLPSGFIGDGVADVFHSRLSEAHRTNPDAVRPLLLRVAIKLGLVSLLIYVPIAFASPLVFDKIFGAKWAQAGWLMTVLAPVGLIALVVNPLSRLFAVVNRPELKLAVDGVRLLAPVLGIYGANRMGYDFRHCAVAFSALWMLSCVMQLVVTWYASGKLEATNEQQGENNIG